MSAISGIYYREDRPVNRADLVRMVGLLTHRGIDGSGVWHAGSVGLGHRMLWTTPESLHEHMPLANQPGDLVLTADARIDNRDELIATLGLKTYPSEAIGDGALILAAYERWGERCPEKLLGDFAFAIWDGRKQVLFCARDPLGVKPFYYYHSDRVVAFASEIKALFCLAAVPHQLNEQAVAYYLTRVFEDRELTFYQNIWRLPAAHSLTIDRQAIHRRCYFALDPTREVRLGSDQEYAEAFRDLFSAAVHCRLRSAFPVGATLSGGLDSSAIVCTARNVLAGRTDQSLHSFSAIFPDMPAKDLRKLDERRYVAAVVETGGVDAHYVHADTLSPLIDLDRVLWHQDEAINAPNLYMHWGLYSAAHQQGVRVFLDGLDGDTTVSHGWTYLAELLWRGRWRTLATEVTAVARRYPAYSPQRIGWEFGLRPLIPPQVLQFGAMMRGRTQPVWGADTAINPVFARRIGLETRVRDLQQHAMRTTHTARDAHWQGLTAPLIPYTLELADKAAAAFALETRYPFFDRRLVEFCLALPPEQKLHQGWTRTVMRRALDGILPPEVQWRTTKANLSPNFKRNLLVCERNRIEQIIFRQPQLIEPYVDMPALRAAYHRYVAQPMHSEQDAFMVYRSVVLATWLRMFHMAV